MRNYYHPFDIRAGETVRMQVGGHIEPRISADIARMAHDEYAKCHDQSFERLHERGGFSVEEIIALLATALERERSK
jgi:hypothetical protein